MTASRLLRQNRWDADNDSPYPFLDRQQYSKLICNGARALGINGYGQMSDGQMYSIKQAAVLLIVRSVEFHGDQVVDLDHVVEETFPLFLISPMNKLAVTFSRTLMAGGYQGYRENFLNLDVLKKRQDDKLIEIFPQPPKRSSTAFKGFDPEKTLLDYIRGRKSSRLQSASLSPLSPTNHNHQDIGVMVEGSYGKTGFQ